MSRTAADLLTARQVARDYRDRASQIDRETADPSLRGMPLTRRILRQYAAIARRAAIEEELDSLPAGLKGTEPVPCSICGGEDVCIG